MISQFEKPPRGNAERAKHEPSARAEELAALGEVRDPEQTEIHLAGAIGNLLVLTPIPWAMVCQLAARGRRIAKAAKEVRGH